MKQLKILKKNFNIEKKFKCWKKNIKILKKNTYKIIKKNVKKNLKNNKKK